MKAVMNVKAGGRTSEFGQKIAEARWEANRGNEVRANELLGRAYQTLSELQKAGDADATFLRGTLEQLNEFRRGTDNGGLRELADQMAEVMATLLDEAKANGVKIGDLRDDEIAYFPRFLWDELERKGILGSRKAHSSFDPSSIQRVEAFQGIGGGTNAVVRMLADEGLNKHVDLIQQAVTQNERDVLINQLVEHMAGLKPLVDSKGQTIQTTAEDFSKQFRANLIGETGAEITPELKHVRQFVELWSDLSPEARGVGLFANHPLTDMYRRFRIGMDRITAAKVAPGAIAEAIKSPSSVANCRSLWRQSRSIRFS